MAEEVLKPVKAVKEEKVDRKTQLESTIKVMQEQYTKLTEQENACIQTIENLNDRILKQQEAKNIFAASKLQLETQFRAIQIELQKLNQTEVK